MAIGLAAAAWAIAAVAAKSLFEDGVTSLELSQARAYVAFLGLALIQIFTSTARRDKGTPGTPGRPWLQVLLLGAAIGLVNAAYYVAIDHLEVAVAIVIQYMAPALVVIWVALRSQTTPERKVIFAVVAALVGVALAADIGRGEMSDLDVIGLVAAVSSAVLFAAYTLLSESAAKHFGPTGALLRAFGAASILWVAFQATQGWPGALFETANIGRVLFVGVVGTLLPFVLYVWGVRRVAAQKAVIVASLEPPLAAFTAWWWLGETLAPVQIAGAILVLVAVGALQYRRRVLIVAEQ